MMNTAHGHWSGSLTSRRAIQTRSTAPIIPPAKIAASSRRSYPLTVTPGRTASCGQPGLEGGSLGLGQIALGPRPGIPRDHHRVAGRRHDLVHPPQLVIEPKAGG